MKDKFEQYIKDNRERLDAIEPRAELWLGVHEKLQVEHKTKPKSKHVFYYLTAASILLIICLSYWWLNQAHNNANVVYKPHTDTLYITQSNPEEYYASMIEAKRNELFMYCSQQPVLCNEFKKDLDTLNNRYVQLKNEYSRAANKDVVLQAMINNLQIQMQILSQQLHIIRRVQSKDNNNEKDFI